MPGTAKITCTSSASSDGPSHPRWPNTSTQTSPAITGDTDNGRSISVTSAFFPRKSNRVIAHAAAMPKAQLHGTAIATTTSVRRSAASASGSASAVTYAAKPFRSALASTNASGSTRNVPTNAIAAAISNRRSHTARDGDADQATPPATDAWTAELIACRDGGAPSTLAMR